ncbi:MAG: hypothetical protein RIT28_3838 [Pseudomonadota bacterium]
MLSFLLLAACATGDINDQLDALDADLAALTETVDDQAALISALEAENAALLTELEALKNGGEVEDAEADLTLEYTLVTIPKASGSINYSQFDYAASFEVLGDADDVRIMQHSGNSPTYSTKIATTDLGDAECVEVSWSGAEEIAYHAFVIEAWRGTSYWCWEVEPFSELVQTDCANPIRVETLTCG